MAYPNPNIAREGTNTAEKKELIKGVSALAVGAQSKKVAIYKIVSAPFDALKRVSGLLGRYVMEIAYEDMRHQFGSFIAEENLHRNLIERAEYYQTRIHPTKKRGS